MAEELEEIRMESPVEIRKLEDLVNRFFSLGIRYVNMVRGKDQTKYFKIFGLLETISDQLYVLAKSGTAKKNTSLFKMLAEELDLCFKGLAGDHQAIGSAVELKNSAIKAAGKANTTDLEEYLIGEIAKNMAKISELGLEITQKELAVE